MRRDRYRRILSHVVMGLCGLSVLAALVPLALILFYVLKQGLSSVNWAFIVDMPKPVGEPGGGMANAIVGTLYVVVIGAAFAVPVGILSGVYAAEYAGTKLAEAVRFAADTLNGVPSIVIGVFAYGVAVLPFRQFSAMAGGFALGIMMIPLIMRTTEELMRLVPGSLKEGALALGATRARAVFTVVLPAALPGIMTGILLALARISGETAPLLFTAFNNQYFSTDLRQPISTLTVQVFTYAISPYEDWHRQAWAGALVLVTIVLTCSLLARAATARMSRMRRGA
ncbi:MAG: phosphate ABC transporter permease PstA [Vicinamibacterales bacterium]